MTRGRHPKPASLAAAQGNVGHRKKPAAPKAPPAPKPVGVPEILTKAKFRGALKLWNRLKPQLDAMRVITGLDVDTLTRYCIHLDNWYEAEIEIKRTGSQQLVETTTGGSMWRLNPAVKVAAFSEQQLNTIGPQLGLNPLDRFKLLREQASSYSGGLFGRDEDKPATPDAPAQGAPAQPEAGIVGLLGMKH